MVFVPHSDYRMACLHFGYALVLFPTHRPILQSPRLSLHNLDTLLQHWTSIHIHHSTADGTHDDMVIEPPDHDVQTPAGRCCKHCLGN